MARTTTKAHDGEKSICRIYKKAIFAVAHIPGQRSFLSYEEYQLARGLNFICALIRLEFIENRFWQAADKP